MVCGLFVGMGCLVVVVGFCLTGCFVGFVLGLVVGFDGRIV